MCCKKGASVGGNGADKVCRSCGNFREFYFGSALMVSHELKACLHLEWLGFMLKESSSRTPNLCSDINQNSLRGADQDINCFNKLLQVQS